jgi:hypothetical protein
MPDEQTLTPDAPTEEQQQEAKDFEAGFAQARGDQPPTNTDETPASPAVAEASPAPADKPLAGASEPAPATKAEPEPAFTPEQFKALIERVAEIDSLKATLESSHAKTHGKIGELNRTLLQIQQAAAASPAGVKLSVGALKRLGEDYPDLAKLLAEDLTEALSATGVPQAAPTVDLAPIEERFAQQLDAANKAHEAKLLTVMFPDWRTTTQSADFRLWLETQPEDYRTRINNSWDALEIADALRTHQAAQAAAKAPAPKQDKTKRLEAAVTPQGVPGDGPPALDPEAEFLAGYKAARGGR